MEKRVSFSHSPPFPSLLSSLCRVSTRKSSPLIDISASKSTHSSVRATLLAEGRGVFRDRRVSRSVLSRLESRQIARQIEGAMIFDEISYPRWKLIRDSRIVFEARVSRQIVYRVKYGILTFGSILYRESRLVFRIHNIIIYFGKNGFLFPKGIHHLFRNECYFERGNGRFLTLN